MHFFVRFNWWAMHCFIKFLRLVRPTFSVGQFLSQCQPIILLIFLALVLSPFKHGRTEAALSSKIVFKPVDAILQSEVFRYFLQCLLFFVIDYSFSYCKSGVSIRVGLVIYWSDEFQKQHQIMQMCVYLSENVLIYWFTFGFICIPIFNAELIFQVRNLFSTVF